MATKPIDGQKTGTSGLRKKTKDFMSNKYLGNWAQSLFNAVGKELGLGGDGRWVAETVCGREGGGVGSRTLCSGMCIWRETPGANVLRRGKLCIGAVGKEVKGNELSLGE
mgnify:CR=1 FL=1